MKSDAEHLHALYPSMHRSPEVQHTVSYLRENNTKIAEEPTAKVAAYIDFLADPSYVNDGILTRDRTSMDYQVNARVIDEQNIPQDYQDAGLSADIIQNQEESLGSWARQLGWYSGYPDWFKLYAWQEVGKLGTATQFLSEQFTKRSKSTVAPFPTLNTDALAETFEEVERHQAGDNFRKVYEYAVEMPIWKRPTIHNTELDQAEVELVDDCDRVTARVVAFGKVVSTAALQYSDRDVTSAYLMNVFTKEGKRYRGQGLARKAIQALEADAALKGVTTISLHSGSDVTEFYEKQGYARNSDSYLFTKSLEN